MYSRQGRLKFVTERQCNLGLSPKQKGFTWQREVSDNRELKKIKIIDIFETACDSDE